MKDMRRTGQTLLLVFLYLVALFSCHSRKKVDEIVIIDVANLDREHIAKEIYIIDSLNPKVIGVDLRFSRQKDFVGDSILSATLNNCGDLVMISAIGNPYYNGADVEYSELSGSLPEFLTNAKTGFANVVLDNDEFRTLSKFSIFERVNGKVEYHFAIQVASEYDSLRTLSFIQKNPRIVDVNFKGNMEVFKIVSAEEVLNRKISEADIQDKIVLFGSFSPSNQDMFFTPLNKRTKPYEPDMHGVIYLANIIAQVLAHEHR